MLYYSYKKSKLMFEETLKVIIKVLDAALLSKKGEYEVFHLSGLKFVVKGEMKNISDEMNYLCA